MLFLRVFQTSEDSNGKLARVLEFHCQLRKRSWWRGWIDWIARQTKNKRFPPASFPVARTSCACLSLAFSRLNNGKKSRKRACFYRLYFYGQHWRSLNSSKSPNGVVPFTVDGLIFFSNFDDWQFYLRAFDSWRLLSGHLIQQFK